MWTIVIELACSFKEIIFGEATIACITHEGEFWEEFHFGESDSNGCGAKLLFC